MSNLLHKSASVEQCKKLSDGKYSFVISSESADLAGDVMRQTGMKLVSDRIPAQIDHSGRMRDVIGYWSDFTTVGKSTTAVLNLAEKGISRTADLIRGLMESGVRMASSIGFSATKREPLKTGGFEYKDWTLMEVSVVACPCNPEALSVAKSLGFKESEAIEILADASPAHSDNNGVSADEIKAKSTAAIIAANRILRKKT